MRKLLPVAALLMLTGTVAAQPSPPPKGYRLHRVRRLRPAPLPPGGLVPFRDTATGTWGLADTLGRPRIPAAFDWVQLFTCGPFMRVRLRDFVRYPGPFVEWRRGYEVWVNARGQYLLAPIGQTAYRQPDGSLRARRISRHLTESQYWYEQENRGQQPDSTISQPDWLRTHVVKSTAGEKVYPVRYLGQGLYAVKGPALRWQYRLRAFLLPLKRRLWSTPYSHPGVWPVPVAVFSGRGRRLTHWYYSFGTLNDGRLRFTAKPRHGYVAGYLNDQGRLVLGPYEKAEDFYQNRAVVALPGADWQHPLYSLIDTTGTHLLPPRPGRLTLPDEAGLLRHEVEQPDHRLWEYLRLDGQPAFPGRYFQRAEPFTGDAAAVVDATGRAGLLRRDGSFQPAP